MPVKQKTLRAKALPASFDDLVKIYPPRAIHDDVDYDNTQEMIDALTNLRVMSKGQEQYLDTLTVLFEAYEDEHEEEFNAKLGPIEVLRHLMEGHDMNASALGEMLGDRALGSRILNGHRALSKAHIRTLADHFRVSTDLFI